MAAPGENRLSVEHFTGMERNTLTKQRELLIKKSRGMQLQQRLQELKERECRAQQHNRQLLLQFERAQDTLTEMLARNAAMKLIRMEYERHLEENVHRWQLQLQEKTQASQKKQRMEDSLKSYLRHNKDQVSTADQPLISQDPPIRVPKFAAPQTYSSVENSAYSRDNSSYFPHPEATWLTQAGMLPGSLRAPFEPQSPSLFPAPNFPYSHPLPLQHPASSFDHHQPGARPEAVGWAPSRYSNPCSDGIPQRYSSQLHTEEPSASRVSQIAAGEDETSAASSKRVRGGGGRKNVSPELDVKPVRLSSEHAESSESGRDSSLASREKKKREKQGRAKPSSSESEICGSQKSSRTSSEDVAASCTVALGSETNTSSEEGGSTSRRRTNRRRGLNTGSPPSEKEAEELNRSEEEEEKSDSLSEKVRSPGEDSKAGSCRGKEGSDSDLLKRETRDEDKDDEEVYSSEQSNTEERDEEKGKKNPGCGDEKKENEVKSEEGSYVVEDKENNEVPPSRNQKEDVEEDEEKSDKLENEENRKQDSSASSQDDDEEESEGSEKIEEESKEEEDQLWSEGDSEDSIICPQEIRSKQMKIIPEEAAEDEEGERDTQSSNSNSKDSSDEEDIENLLAPQEPANKKENAVKTEGKPKAKCLDLGIFQVTEDRAKTNHKSDSEEFDDFYD